MSFISFYNYLLTVSLLAILYCNLTCIMYFCSMQLLEKFLNEELNILDGGVRNKFEEYNRLILDWNSKINLISRKNDSIEEIVLNSLFFLKKYDINVNSKILDIGTGGGFPGVPLKILFPGLRVTLVDSIRKKINALSDIIKQLNLSDTKAVCCRAEKLSAMYGEKYDYVVSKSVAPLSDLASWSNELLNADGEMLCIKGGNLESEISDLKRARTNFSVSVLEYAFDKIYKIDDKKLVILKMH